MFVLEDYLEHDTFGPVLARNLEKERQEGTAGRTAGRAAGVRQEGHQEGRNEGKREGALQLVQRGLAKRFGEVPDSLLQQLSGLSIAELEEFNFRVFTANKPEDLLN